MEFFFEILIFVLFLYIRLTKEMMRVFSGIFDYASSVGQM